MPTTDVAQRRVRVPVQPAAPLAARGHRGLLHTHQPADHQVLSQRALPPAIQPSLPECQVGQTVRIKWPGCVLWIRIQIQDLRGNKYMINRR